MTTENKKIQEERMKGYFIDSTKKILKGEGLKAVNVRNIAREAGYSYATLYNYFKDIKDLVFECIKDFQSECQEIVNSETENSARGIEKIKMVTRSYIKYFIQYPGIFELFYLEKTGDLGHKKPTLTMIYNFLDVLYRDEWNYCVENNIFSKESIETKSNILKNLSVGMLLFYLNRYSPADYSKFIELSNKQIDYIRL